MRHFEVGEGAKNIVISDSSVEFPDPVIDFSLAGTIKLISTNGILGMSRLQQILRRATGMAILIFLMWC
ncbi:MAG: hypothetical protein R3B93_24660 [Bacteroidia bacterium]